MKTTSAPTSTKAAAARKESPGLQQTFILKNRNGLHARPCALLVKRLRVFQCEITVECHGQLANAQSILGLMALAAGYESKLTFTATGKDAALALAAVKHLFDTHFEEAYQ